MTITQTLDDVYYLPSEIGWLEDDIAKLHGTGDPRWNETIELESQRLQRAKADLQRGIDLIASVEHTDPLLYKVLVMRYIEGLTWAKIAAVMPAKATPDCYKMMVYRWIKKLENAEVK